MKYIVLYGSVGGVMTGKKPGEAVNIPDKEEAAHLLGLGLIESEEDYEIRQKQKAEASEDAGTEEERLRAAQDQVLEAYKRGGGWFHFGAGDDLVKVQGREDALAELKRRTTPQ